MIFSFLSLIKLKGEIVVKRNSESVISQRLGYGLCADLWSHRIERGLIWVRSNKCFCSVRNWVLSCCIETAFCLNIAWFLSGLFQSSYFLYSGLAFFFVFFAEFFVNGTNYYDWIQLNLSEIIYLKVIEANRFH